MSKAKLKSIEGWSDRARELMASRGLTYENLAESLGVSTRGSVSHYFQGRRTLSAEQAVALADLLECSLEWLLTGETTERVLTGKSRAQELVSPDELVESLHHLRPDIYQSVARLITELSQPKARPRRRAQKKA